MTKVLLEQGVICDHANRCPLDVYQCRHKALHTSQGCDSQIRYNCSIAPEGCRCATRLRKLR